MKKIVLAFAFVFISYFTFAQMGGHPSPKGDFKKLQAEMILRELKLPEESQAQFRDLYAEYAAQMDSLRPRHRRGVEQPTSEDVEQHIFESFDMTDKITDLKREYYPKFKEILSPEQILRMYSAEQQLRNRMSDEQRRRRE